MSYGICTRYQKHDATFAALAVARFMGMNGFQYSIAPRGWRATDIDMRWDHKILSRYRNFSSWFTNNTVCVWTEYAPADYLAWLAYRRPRIKNILYTGLDCIRYDDEVPWRMMDMIFVPTSIQADIVRKRWHLDQVATMPYDCGFAPTIKSKLGRPGFVRFFMSLYGSQLRRTDLQAVIRLAEVARHRPNVSVTIGCAGGLTQMSRTVMRNLRREIGPRFNVVHKTQWTDHIKYMANADVTVWPTMTDGHGIIPRTSLSQGTPVLGFKFHPADVFIRPDTSGWLVPCAKIDTNWLGVDIARPDWDAYEATLESLAADSTKVEKMLLGASMETGPCHKLFNDRWLEILAE